MRLKAKKKLMNWLLSQAGTRHFFMDSFIDENSCGTTLCLAGAAATLLLAENNHSTESLAFASKEYLQGLIRENVFEKFKSQNPFIYLASIYLDLPDLGDDSSLFFLENWPIFYQSFFFGDNSHVLVSILLENSEKNQGLAFKARQFITALDRNYLYIDHRYIRLDSFWEPLAAYLLLKDMSEEDDLSLNILKNSQPSLSRESIEKYIKSNLDTIQLFIDKWLDNKDKDHLPLI